MSEFDPSRSGQHSPRGRVDAAGTGLLWLLVAVAVLGLLVLFGALGAGRAPIEHPGGAGADPVRLPSGPEN